MLKRIVYILLFSISSVSQSAAQNLVLNGSFEEYYSFPAFQGNIDSCKYWFQPLKESTSDWFHKCYPWAANGGMGVPKNIWGNQYARTGKGYAGIVGYYKPYSYWYDKREYIETKLASPLEGRKIYCVRFFVSLADSISKFSINNMSTYFTTDSVLSNGYFLDYPFIDAQAQVSSPQNQFLNDYQNWMEISGSFMAQGGEQFLTLGNFKKDSEIQIQTANSSILYKSAYYYIDDVVVYPCDAPVYTANAGDDVVLCNKEKNYELNTELIPEYNYVWYSLKGDTIGLTNKCTVNITKDTAFVLQLTDFKYDVSYDTIAISIKDCNVYTPEFNIYPNIISDNTLQIHSKHFEGNVSVLLYDAIGKLIYKQAINISQPDQTTTLKTMDLASGFYVCKIMNGNEVLKSERVVVVNE
ncbi:MAG: T9SS type A sorting domain-containing protein [Bacteroidota bacterium]